MGTSLTGLTPAATYQGLIKFGDNSAISASLRYLSDGLGNDLPISVASNKIGVNTITGSSLINIKGTGASTSTSSLNITDSTGANLFKFNDNAAMSIGLNSNPSTTANSLVIGLTTTNDQLTITSSQLLTTLGTLKLASQGTYIQANSLNDCVQVGNSGFGVNATPTSSNQRMVVKGWGSTSATTNLLLQNSSSTQLFKAFDDGVIEAGGATANQFKVMNTEGLAISRDGSLDANIRIREFSGSGPVFKMNGNSTPTFKMVDSSNFNCIVTHANWTGIAKGTVENTSAALQTDSTSRGWLPPRMTDAQVRAIATPAVGLTMYNTDLDCPVFYSSAGWRKISHSVM